MRCTNQTSRKTPAERKVRFQNVSRKEIRLPRNYESPRKFRPLAAKHEEHEEKNTRKNGIRHFRDST